MSDPTSDPRQVVRAWLDASGIEYDETAPGMFSFALPGTRKLQTPVRVDVGAHTLALHAFVCRRPDENHEGVHRWLLERNLKTYGASFALDHLGDIYLDGRLPLDAATPEALDRLLGALVTTADESFNQIIRLGFGSAIRKEWEWRLSRGESTANLEAFRGWLEGEESD